MGSGTRWGFVNPGAAWVLPPEFEGACPFHTVLYSTIRGAGCITIAMVKFHGKWGFIDVQGRFCVEPLYDESLGFADRWAAMRIGPKWAYINSVGEEMISRRFDIAFPFDDMDMKKGRALVKLEGAYHIIDRSGVVVDDRPVHDFSKGLLLMKIGDDFTFLNGLASEPFRERFSWASPFSCDRARVITRPGSRYGFIDTTGKMVIPEDFGHASDFTNGIAFVSASFHPDDASIFRAIDVDGNDAIPPLSRKELQQTLIPVKVGSVWGYVDYTGTMIIMPRFETAGPFSNGQAVVKGNRGEEGGLSKWFMIDKTGTYLFETTPLAETPVGSIPNPDGKR